MEKVLSIDKTPSVIQVANQGKSKLSNSVENASKNKPMNSEDSIKQQLFRSTVKDPAEGPNYAKGINVDEQIYLRPVHN